MEVFVLFSTDEKPRKLQTRGFAISDGYECDVPIPLPEMVLVFTVGTWPTQLEGQMLRLQVGIEDFNKFTLGTVTEEHRSFCWQGNWRDDLYIKSELMSDEESMGHLVMIPEPIRPITPPSYRGSPCSKKTMDIFDEDIKEQLESSKTESDTEGGMDVDEQGQNEKESSKTEQDRVEKKKDEEDMEPTTATSLINIKVDKKKQVTKTSSPEATSTKAASQSKKRKASSEAAESKTKKSTNRRTMRTREPKESTTSNKTKPSPSSTSNKSKSSPGSTSNKTKQASLGSRNIMSFMKTGPRPSARWGHSLSDIGNNQALLVGGQGTNQILAKDSIWLLNTDSKEWTLPDITIDSKKPEHRMGHTATYDPKVKCLYVFGGSKNLRWYNDIHVLDLDSWKWSLVQANGKAPTRAYHSSTLFRNELFIFGGVFPNPDPQPDGCSNQVFVYNPLTESWYEPVLLGNRPKPRSGHSATRLGDKLVIFGGWDAPECFNDLHILDLCLMEFTSPTITGKPPSPRSWHGAVELPGNKVLIHGGYDGEKALDDSFIFDLESSAWSTIKLPISITSRAGHSLLSLAGHENIPSSTEEELEEKENTPKKCAKPPSHKLMLFAGGDNDGTFFNDLIRFSLKKDNY